MASPAMYLLPLTGVADIIQNAPCKKRKERTIIMSEKIKLIATEEHFHPPTYLTDPEIKATIKNDADLARIRTEHAHEFAKERVAKMDAGGIDKEILLAGLAQLGDLTGDEEVKIASELNKFLLEIIKSSPGRFEGFVTVPTSVPEAAVEEISLAITEYGFKGVLLFANLHGRYLDDMFFDPILKKTDSMGVPIYLHPTPPSQIVFDTLYAGNYPKEVSQRFSTAGWGWHIEVAVHLLRATFSGVFDRYPKLQFIIGHLGEALPYMLQRLDSRIPQKVSKLERPISAYLRENVYYTISGWNFLPSFLTMYMQVGADRIMFSVDTPNADMIETANFLNNLPICDTDKRRIGYENAEKLLKI